MSDSILRDARKHVDMHATTCEGGRVSAWWKGARYVGRDVGDLAEKVARSMRNRERTS